MKDLDPAALDCLAALADEASFERAAQRLSITQSAVSQRLKSLEAQVGRLLLVRSRPLRLTEPGKVLLRFARQMHAMRADVARELGAASPSPERLPIAVNADSLATWVMPALDELVRGGLSLELVVDDQDFTHDWLRQGAVLGCVSTVREALRGCRVVPLGVMRYTAVASPEFVARELAGGPAGLNRSTFAQLPFLIFNRKDDMQEQWVSLAFGVRAPGLHERFVPSSEAYVRAALMGWGVGVAPLVQVQGLIDAGALVPLMPDVTLEVELFWHQWRLGPDGDESSTSRVGMLDRIGRALAAGAAKALVAGRALREGGKGGRRTRPGTGPKSRAKP
jgi:LysR family transcriptional regulator (chromosome initiation inhibitor)